MLLEDEAGFYRQPTMAPMWAPAGRRQPRAAWATRSNHVIRAAVGLDPVSGRLLHRLRSSFTALEMGRFYRFLLERCPMAKRIYLVMDNWPVHEHPTAWRYLVADARVRVLWLPTYAPWLNPAEKVWKWVRQTLTHMHPFTEELSVLRERLDRLLTRANDDPAAMMRYTGTGDCKLYSS